MANLDGDGRLVVRVSGERLLLFARYAGVALDQFGHHAAGRLYAERQGCDVDQQHVLDGRTGVATEYGRLHGRPVRHGLVRVDGQVQRFAAEEVLNREIVIVYLGFLGVFSIFYGFVRRKYPSPKTPCPRGACGLCIHRSVCAMFQDVSMFQIEIKNRIEIGFFFVNEWF